MRLHGWFHFGKVIFFVQWSGKSLSPFSPAFTLIVVVLVIVDLSDKREDIQLLVPLDIFAEGCGDGFFFCAVLSDPLCFFEKSIINGNSLENITSSMFTSF